jgi:CDP-glycerol glycerophosphotransferase (TagB/SpsB family)
MFTWRDLKKKKTISSDYFKNIIDLIENSILCKCLEKNNIILYFTLHHLLENYINKYKKKYKDSKYIHYITDKDISNCLSTTSLIVSDFSSIIFDQIYRRKPFVIYVPDANDPEIRNLYTNNYFELIQSMKNGSIEFENKFFELNETVNKIIYYINNKFKLDEKLIVFYDSFHLEKKEHTKLFINYLKNMQ